MDVHPLLNELLEVCAAHDVEPAKAYTTFEVFQELCEIRKLAELKYFFNEELKLFYLSGKKEPTDEIPNIYVPVKFSDEITPQEISSMQEILNSNNKEIYLFIRDADSSSACYSITNNLVRPDSPETCKRKKEIEGKKYQFEKNIQNHRKSLYMMALRQKKAEETINPFSTEQ